MPELPEVETIARGVDARVRGDRIVDVWFGSHREPFKTPAARQARGLEGRSVSGGAPGGKAHCVRSGRCVRRRFREERPSSQGAVDCASGDDRAAAGDHARRPGGGAYPRAADAGQRAGASVCGPAAVWAAGVARSGAAGRVWRAGRGAAEHWAGGICRAVSRAADWPSRRLC